MLRFSQHFLPIKFVLVVVVVLLLLLFCTDFHSYLRSNNLYLAGVVLSRTTAYDKRQITLYKSAAIRCSAVHMEVIRNFRLKLIRARNDT